MRSSSDSRNLPFTSMLEGSWLVSWGRISTLRIRPSECRIGQHGRESLTVALIQVEQRRDLYFFQQFHHGVIVGDGQGQPLITGDKFCAPRVPTCGTGAQFRSCHQRARPNHQRVQTLRTV